MAQGIFFKFTIHKNTIMQTQQ